MTAADQIRALADTGTPGPFTAEAGGSEGYYVWGARGQSLARRNHPEARDRVALVNCLDWQSDKENAEKIVAAVNALPRIADLIGVVDDEHRQFSESCVMCGGLWPCDYAAARDALVDALGVTA